MELLRILAMFMIVIYHITVHSVSGQVWNGDAGNYFNQPLFFKRLLAVDSLFVFGIVGNAVFLLISGYFLANRGGSEIRIGSTGRKLLLQLGFAMILLVCVPPICFHIWPDTYWSMLDITSFNTVSWYAGYYFIVVLCGSLFLNDFLGKLNEKKYGAYLLTLFAFIELSWSGALADGLTNGLRTALTGIFLYSLGGFIKKYDPFGKIRIYILFVITLGVYLLFWLSIYNVTESRIQSYYRSASTDVFSNQYMPGFENYNIIIMILAVCLFEFFRRIHLPNSKIISFVGKGTFMVYLIHDNSLFYNMWNNINWQRLISTSPTKFMLSILECAICTFLIGICAYALYVGVSKLMKRMRLFAIKQ